MDCFKAEKATAVARMRRVCASNIPSLPAPNGALAQLGERLICIQEVIGSIPIGSTKTFQALAQPITFSELTICFGTSRGSTSVLEVMPETRKKNWVGSSGG